jgi:hypothetical protein
MTPNNTYNPPSANGWCLHVRQGRATWFVTAAWRAPYFALCIDHDDDRAPMLYHAESLEAARSVSFRVFDAEFLPVARPCS